MYDLATHPAIIGRMVALYGPDLLLWRTNFFVKNRGSKAIPWHQDFHYWPLEPPVIISAWMAVDPSTRQNGNLQVIPGSHRTIVPHVEATPDMQFKVMADAGYYDPGDLTELEMQPGEFILFNERTLHHSEANHSDLRRIGLAARGDHPHRQGARVRLRGPFPADHPRDRHHGPQSPRAAAAPIAEPSASASPAMGTVRGGFTR